jgi:hypothetical protein
MRSDTGHRGVDALADASQQVALRDHPDQIVAVGQHDRGPDVVLHHAPGGIADPRLRGDGHQ